MSMRERDIHAPPGDLGINRLLAIFAALAVALLIALALAPARSTFTEWREVQERYNAAAAPLGVAPVEVDVQQTWRPELELADRCGSCHVVAAGAEPVGASESKVFAEHPPIPHETTEFGCTPCHAGQGRATTKEAAHGKVHHWHDPLLPREHFQAGCGTCHTNIPAPDMELAERGAVLFAQNACRDCHKVNGVGLPDGVDLSAVGMRSGREGWYERHLASLEEARRTGESDRPWTTSFGELSGGQVRAIDAHLSTLIGAPRLMEARLLSHRLGCRGCHIIGGIGGEDGPDLAGVGTKIAEDLDWSGVRGEHTVANWHFEHLLNPPRVVADSEMPIVGLTRAQASLLTTYVLAQRSRDLPATYLPRDRVRVQKLNQRDFASNGASVFREFCAGCHGERGQGLQFPAMEQTFPAVASPELLVLADRDDLRTTVAQGRRARRMPAWGGDGGILRPGEIEAIVTFLLGMRPEPPPSLDQVEAVLAEGDGRTDDPLRGESIYAKRCVGCHGPAGRGAAAPAIGTSAFLDLASDRLIAGTIVLGRSGTAMPAFGRATVSHTQLPAGEVLDVTAYLRGAPGEAGDEDEGEANDE